MSAFVPPQGSGSTMPANGVPRTGKTGKKREAGSAGFADALLSLAPKTKGSGPGIRTVAGARGTSPSPPDSKRPEKEIRRKERTGKAPRESAPPPAGSAIAPMPLADRDDVRRRLIEDPAVEKADTRFRRERRGTGFRRAGSPRGAGDCRGDARDRGDPCRPWEPCRPGNRCCPGGRCCRVGRRSGDGDRARRRNRHRRRKRPGSFHQRDSRGSIAGTFLHPFQGEVVFIFQRRSGNSPSRHRTLRTARETNRWELRASAYRRGP